MMLDPATIAQRIDDIRQRMHKAAQRVNRSADEVTLIGVTKTHPPHLVATAVAAGLRDVGENRVQEAEEKIEVLAAQREQMRWHLIGHLQRNKAKRAVQLFDIIHTVDSLRLAETLNRHLDEASEQGQRRLPILLQVNVSGEASKDGYDLRGGTNGVNWDPWLETVHAIAALPRLDVQGLMTIAPFSSDIEGVVRPCFRALRETLQALKLKVPHVGWQHLSMGMSGDFEVAIEEGATLVRVGTAIFGAR